MQVCEYLNLLSTLFVLVGGYDVWTEDGWRVATRLLCVTDSGTRGFMSSESS